MAKTIKESAEMLGISTQAIYKRIKNMDDNQLATFLTTDDNGVRMLTTEGLQFIGGDRKEETMTKEDSIESSESTTSQADQQLVTWLQTEISKLNDELKIERENSRELTRKLIKITENQQALLGHNMGMKQVDSQSVVQSIKENEEEIAETEKEKSQDFEETKLRETEEISRKDDQSKGFFSRLFKK